MAISEVPTGIALIVMPGHSAGTDHRQQWQVKGQQLEPRAYSVSPVGTNIIILGYGRSTGDGAFDPSLPITDANATINGAFGGFSFS